MDRVKPAQTDPKTSEPQTQILKPQTLNPKPYDIEVQGPFGYETFANTQSVSVMASFTADGANKKLEALQPQTLISPKP